MQKLIDGLKHFQEHLNWERRELFERATKGQRPTAMLITCSDSRLLPETILQADPGDLFVSRNAGNLVPPPDAPSGEAATVEYAIQALGVTDIIICGHYRCGAVRTVLNPDEGQGLPKTREWLASAAETKATIEAFHPGLVGDALWDKAVERNVLAQLSNLTKHPVVADALLEGKVRLHAWVLRFETNEVLAFSPDSAAFIPLLEMPVIHPAIPSSALPSPPEPETNEKPKPADSKRSWLETFCSDIPASLVVFAVALPLCVAIAKASGVSAAAGIVTAIIGGIIVGLFGGSAVQVSGPTASLIAVVLAVRQELGPLSLGMVVVLAGLIQLTAGALRLGQWFRAVSPAVILGMLAGIGLTLVGQQFHITVDDDPKASPLANFIEIPRALVDIFGGHSGHSGHLPAAMMGVLTLFVLIAWKKVAPKPLKSIPSVLAAVIVATTVTWALGLPIQRVEFDGLQAGIKVMDFSSLPSVFMTWATWRMAFTIAFLASAETLLTSAATDGMHSGPRTRYDRELAAQGLGNALCGMIGALPLAGVIVRTSTNLQAGAKSRWSAIFHGVWMLVFALAAPGLLSLIPVAALAAILVVTGVKLVQINAIRDVWKESQGEALICIAVIATVVSVNLVMGILLGIALSIFKLLHTFSRLRVRLDGDEKGQRMVLTLEGSATFLRLPRLATVLEKIPPSVLVHVDSKGLSYIDHTCLTLLTNWEKRHVALGGKAVVDWDTLKSRFNSARPRPSIRRDSPRQMPPSEMPSGHALG